MSLKIYPGCLFSALQLLLNDDIYVLVRKRGKQDWFDYFLLSLFPGHDALTDFSGSIHDDEIYLARTDSMVNLIN
jgi:hypothetical protein